MNFFTPTDKPIGFTETASRRRRRIYDKPETPRQRVKRSSIPIDVAAVETRIAGINPADLTLDITEIQQQLTQLAAEKNEHSQRPGG